MSVSHPLFCAQLVRESARPLLPPAWPAPASVPWQAAAGARPIRTVLVVTDFSVQGDQALECAAQLAAVQGATLTVLHAHHPRA